MLPTQVLGNVGFELSSQTATQLALTGQMDLGRYDFVDIGLSATRLNFVGQAITGSFLDIDLNNGLNFNKSVQDIGVDFATDLITPGFKNLGRSIRPMDNVNSVFVNTGGVIIETTASFSKSSKK